MLSNAEKFYSVNISPINWKIIDPLKDSRESAVALGYAGPSHMEIMTKEVRKGKYKDYELYILGKIHDEEQIQEAKVDVNNYFSMKEVSQYNIKNVTKEKGEISRKETWDQIRQIQQTKNYVFRKYSDKLKKEIESESDKEKKTILSEILKNIKKLDILIKDTKNDKLKEFAQQIEKQIEDEIKYKIKQDEEKGKLQKRKQEEKMEIDQEIKDDLDEKLYEQEKKKKKFIKQFEESLIKKPKSTDIKNLLGAAKASQDDILKFFKTKPESTKIQIVDTSKKTMDWDFN